MSAKTKTPNGNGKFANLKLINLCCNGTEEICDCTKRDVNVAFFQKVIPMTVEIFPV